MACVNRMSRAVTMVMMLTGPVLQAADHEAVTRAGAQAPAAACPSYLQLRTTSEAETLFDAARVMGTPKARRVDLAMWGFWGRDFWPLTHVDSAVSDLEQGKGMLRFVPRTNSVTLGFGRFLSDEPAAEPQLQVDGDVLNQAVLAVRLRTQASNVVVDVDFRYGGDPGDAGYWGDRRGRGSPFKGIPGPTLKGTLKPGEWGNLRARINRIADADGMGLHLATSTPGIPVDIQFIRIAYTDSGFCARKVVTIPEGRLYKAKATVSVNQDLFVNGHRVREQWRGLTYGVCYNLVGVDLKPYLRTGDNVIALRQKNWRLPPHCWMLGAAHMTTGATVSFGTDDSWKASSVEEPGWLEPGFDDLGWSVPGPEHGPDTQPEKLRPRLQANYVTGGPARVPVNTTQLDVFNPYGKKLFYNTDLHPVDVLVTLPPGLDTDEAHVEYALWHAATGDLVAQGRIESMKKTDVCLESRLSFGRLPRGVYGLVLDGAEGRNPVLALHEALVVVGKIPMPLSTGLTWDDNMNVRLVDEVDCTADDDSHEFCDASIFEERFASRVVTRQGLTYREGVVAELEKVLVRDRNMVRQYNDQFAWLNWVVSFPNPGRPHCIEIEYPDDLPRSMAIQIHSRVPKRIWNPRHRVETAWAVSGIQAGGRYPLSGKMQKHRIIFWAHEPTANVFATRSAARGDQGPRVEHLNHGAALARIKVYEIDELAALDVSRSDNPRLFGIYNERERILCRTFGGAAHQRIQRSPLYREDLSPRLAFFAGWLEVAERYARYCRYTGLNMHGMGSWQYRYTPDGVQMDTGAEGASLVPDYRDVIVNVLGANGIATYSTIEWGGDRRRWHLGWHAPHQVLSEGADLMFQVDREGLYDRGRLRGVNPMASPTAFESLVLNLGHITRRFAPYEAWKGFIMVPGPGWWGPAYAGSNVSYDDASIGRFEQATGVHVGVDDRTTARFGKRYDWLRANAWEDWLDWRSRRMADMHDELAAALQKDRPDLDYLVTVGLTDPVHWASEGVWGDDDRESGGEALGFFREYGYDPRRFTDTRHMSLGRLAWAYSPVTGYRLGGALQWPYLRHPPLVQAFNRGAGRHRIAFTRTGFDEGLIVPLALAETPPIIAGYKLAHFWPAHRHAPSHFNAMLQDSDIDTFFIGFNDCTMGAGAEDILRRFTSTFTQLPRERFNVVDAGQLDPNVSVRTARVGGRTWLLLINRGWWQATAAVHLEHDQPVRTCEDAEVVASEANGAVEVVLAPYGLYAAWSSGAIDVKRVAVDIAPAAGDFMQDRIEAYRRALDAPSARTTLGEFTHSSAASALSSASSAFKSGDLASCWRHLSAWPLYRAVTTITSSSD